LDSRDPSANFIERTKSVRNLETDASNVERLNRWTAAWKMFLEKPHTGFGPGTYQYTYIPFQEQKFENHLTVKNPDNPPPGSGGSAHSEIMLQLSENGWPSTALFVFLVLRWIIIGLQKLQTKNHVLIACWLGLLTYLFHMQFNNFLNTDAFAFLFWTFGAGIDLSIYQTRKNEQPILQ
ncbi:MAG: O-antigen ligase family protein, partial [Flavobacteriales bacterium]